MQLPQLPTLGELLHSNPILGGGAMLAVAGGVFKAGWGTIQSAYQRVWTFGRQRMFLTVTVNSDDDIFVWLQQWFAASKKGQRAKNLNLETRWPTDRERNELGLRGRQVMLSPGIGEHFFKHGKSLVWVHVSREKIEGQAGYRSNAKSYVDTMVLRLLRGGRQELLALILEAKDRFYEDLANLVTIKENDEGSWQTVTSRKRRALESLVFPDGFLDQLVADVVAFDAERDWYASIGVPHRRGYLLYGPPGNGKSSLAFALAGATGRDVFCLNLSATMLSDAELRSLLANLPPNSLVLMEDIDAVCAGRDVQTANGLTFSGVLNALDGVASAEGRVLVMTTNHPEVLDGALVRPGRIDEQFEIGNATSYQAERLFLRFFPGEQELAQQFACWGEGKSMAVLQERLVRYRADAPEAAKEP